MAIVPPDPGYALQLAKIYEYDASAGGFLFRKELRWLYPEAGRVWVATSEQQRRISGETYRLLRAGEEPSGALALSRPGAFLVGDEWYQLLDNGFEAVAVPA